MSAIVITGSDVFVEGQAAARAQGFTRDSWIFLSLAALITVLRTYSRWSIVGLKGFQADDLLVWLALVSGPCKDTLSCGVADEYVCAASQGLYAGENVIDNMLLGEFKGLANHFTNDADRATLNPESSESKLRFVRRGTRRESFVVS